MNRNWLVAFIIVLFTGGNALAQDNPLWLRFPAVSPDGSTIAFSYQGDIFTVPVGGGEARQLTSNPAYDAYPVWSPDGQKIAFASRREGSMDVWIMSSRGGTPTRVTNSGAGEIPVAFKNNETILFRASGMGDAQTCIFPGSQTNTYEMDLKGGRPRLFSEIEMNDLSINAAGQVLYHNNKGYEDPFRKHHTSPIARDIWMEDKGKFTKVSDFTGENRTPRWASDGVSYYYLSEEDGTFNVYRRNINGSDKKQLTSFRGNPVRFLTVSNNNLLAFAYDGEIYTLREGDAAPAKVSISISKDSQTRDLIRQIKNSGATEISISPKNKEIAFVMHGDVYVTSLDYSTTKRITDTPEEERDIDFAPDGRSIVYASERGGAWQIYQTAIANKDEKSFAYSTELKEEKLIDNGITSQMPEYSPDGKKVAFMENRTELKVLDLSSRKVITALDGKYMYSYADGDVWYEWSPDSRWFLANYIGKGGWNNPDIALVKADGSGEVHNLTESGYTNGNARWVLDGKAMIFESDREGYRSHGSWGAQSDAYIMFFDLEAYEKFKRTKEECEVDELKTKEEVKEEKKQEKEDKKAEEKAEKKGEEPKEKEIEPLKFDLENCRDRVIRLTAHSSHLGDFVLDKEGENLYYQSAFEGGYDLWKRSLKEGNTTLVNKGFGGGALVWDKDMKNLYFCTGDIKKYDVGANSVSSIDFEAEFNYRPFAEREYLFEHVWRQVKDKFYDPQIHGVDWEGYRQTYRRFLPYITTKEDFSDLLSEMLGELNASHTGARYYARNSAFQPASLGLFFDEKYDGDGLLVKEVLRKGPFAVKDTGVKAGSIIEKINGVDIKAGEDYDALLAGKAGERVRITFAEKKGGKSREVWVKAISRGMEEELLYKRWVERNRQLVDSLSSGRLAYVHVRAMDSDSYREVFSELLNDKNRNRDAVIVDERHNGGGWLHDDLCTLLSGKEYQKFVPHGQYVGSDPWNKWNKPSCVLICEDDYSNGHGFPWVYKTLGIGKLIGAPVAGTMTAVWWERMMDSDFVFGIPQVGCQALDGHFGENTTLYPDIEVYNTPEDYLNGYDRQLIIAIQEMMKEVK